MTALTQAYDAGKKESDIVLYAMAAVKIYKGALVSVTTSTGLVSPAGDTTSTLVVGVAYETVDNSGGSAGALSIRVQKTGRYRYHKTSAVQSDVGKSALVVDDNTVATSGTTNSIVAGKVSGLISSSMLEITIDGRTGA